LLIFRFSRDQTGLFFLKSDRMEALRIEVSEGMGTVSALWQRPDKAAFALVLAHGAGAGMRHVFMGGLAEALAGEGVATLRFQFPYMEQGRKRPDSPRIAQQTIAAAVARAAELAAGLPLFAGGKSFGGRMTSQLAAEGGLEKTAGLVFYGFPLHAAGRPGADRAGHLASVPQPMLFLQGTRDRLAEVDLMREVCRPLPKATLLFVEDGDHSFRMLKRAGISDEAVIRQLARATREWMAEQ
jgi:predicted alpha/beta-hydrolase family hydrolase